MAKSNQSDHLEGEFQSSGKPPERSQSVNGGLIVADGGMSERSYYVRKPIAVFRDPKRIKAQVIEEATASGDLMYYSWTVPNRRTGRDEVIEGGSIGLAMCIARYFGNLAIDSLPLQETSNAYIFTSRAIDLESGFTVERQYRHAKSGGSAGKYEENRMDDMKFQSAQSKALRNVIKAIVPSHIWEAGIEAGKSGVLNKIEEYIKAKGIAAAQDKAISALKKLGVEEAAILGKFGFVSRTAMDLHTLAVVAANTRAIMDGQARAEEVFPPIPVKEGDTQQGNSALRPGETMTAGGEIIPPKSTKEQLDEVIDRGQESAAFDKAVAALKACRTSEDLTKARSLIGGLVMRGEIPQGSLGGLSQLDAEIGAKLSAAEKPSNSEKPQETSQKEPERSTEAEKPETSNTPENLDAEPPEPGPPEYVESAAYKKLFDEVSGVTSKAGLTFMRKKIKEMQDKGEISPDEFAALEVNISEKRDGLAK